MNGNFSKAKNGGRNHGLYIALNKQTDMQLLKSINSYRENVKEHYKKTQNPAKYVLNWETRSERYKIGIINKWEKDISRNQEQLEIAVGVAEERGIDL